MVVHTKILKWGNGLALRVSGIMRDIPHFDEGTEVEVEVFAEGFSVKKVLSKPGTIFPYSEAQLLQGLTPETAHCDLLTNPLSNEIE